MPVDTLSARLMLGGAAAHVVSLDVTETLSDVTRGVAQIAHGSELTPSTFAGGGTALELLVDGQVVRSIALVVGEMAFERVTSGSLRYGVRLYSSFWLLTQTLGTRKFRNMSAQDIVSQVLGEGGVAHRWEIARTPPVRKYCVQYRESHFDFVSRLLEREGIFYVPQDDGSLLLHDDSTAVPMVDGETSFSLLEHAGVLEGGEMGVHQFGWGARMRSGKATMGDYNWKKPKVLLRETAAGGKDADLETYDYPAGFRKPGDGAYLAQVQLEAHRARARYARGSSNVVHFAPGRRMSFDETELTLVSVTHEVVDPAFSDEEGVVAYRNRFEAIPSGTKFRAEWRTPRPAIQGCHTVLVTGPEGEEIHTDEFGRFRAQFHWDREATGTDADSRWLRKLQESATSLNLARVGWEVSVAYIDGDPDRPVGLARDINGKMVPAYGQPAAKEVMTIKTPTYPGGDGYNEIKLDDRGGAQQLNWRAQRDMRTLIKNDKTLTVTRNEVQVAERRADHTVGHDHRVTIGAERSQSIVADHRVSVGNDRTISVGGNQKVDVDGGMSISVQGRSAEAVGSLRFSLVGEIKPPTIDPQALAPDPEGAAKGAGKSAIDAMRAGGGLNEAGAAAGGSLQSMVPTPEGAASQLTGGLSDGNWRSLLSGAIARSASESLSRTVGAVHLAISGESVTTDGARVHAETIGGAKLSLCKESLTQSGGKVMVATTGGAVFRKAKGEMGYGAEKSNVTVGGLTSFKTKEDLEITAKEIKLQAAISFGLKGADLSIVLKPSAIEIKGAMRIDADNKVLVRGNKDNLSKAEGAAE